MEIYRKSTLKEAIEIYESSMMKSFTDIDSEKLRGIRKFIKDTYDDFKAEEYLNLTRDTKSIIIKNPGGNATAELCWMFVPRDSTPEEFDEVCKIIHSISNAMCGEDKLIRLNEKFANKYNLHRYELWGYIICREWYNSVDIYRMGNIIKHLMKLQILITEHAR